LRKLRGLRGQLTPKIWETETFTDTNCIGSVYFVSASCCSESFASWTSKDLVNWCHCELHKQWRNVYVLCSYDAFHKGEQNFIKTLKQDKCYGARQLLNEFYLRQRPRLSLDDRLLGVGVTDFLQW